MNDDSSDRSEPPYIVLILPVKYAIILLRLIMMARSLKTLHVSPAMSF